MSEHSQGFFPILQRHRLTRGGKTALICEGREVSFALLDDQINRFGNVLKGLGVRPKERVIVALPDGPDCFYAFLGSMKGGAWPVLLSPELAAGDYEFIVKDTQATALVTVERSAAATVSAPSVKHRLIIEADHYQALFAAASAVLEPASAATDDAAFLMYTTGGSGELRGVPHSQSAMLCCAENYAGRVLNMSEHDVVFSASKLSLSYGLGNSLIFPLYFGASVVLSPARSTPAEAFRVVAESRPTIIFAVPTLYGMMLKTLDEEVQLASLRLCVSAGEALPAALYHEWKKATGLEIIEGLGATETLHIFIANRPGASHPGSSGAVVPSYEVRLTDEDGQPAAPGEPGLLLVRGRSIASRYWNRPEATAKAMLADGWLKTGDICLEEDGRYTHQGRADTMFKAGGQWVSPARVEAVLQEHPSVKACLVTPHKLEGLLKPIAHVVLKPGTKGDMAMVRELRSHVLGRLPKTMCPVQFNFREDLPNQIIPSNISVNAGEKEGILGGSVHPRSSGCSGKAPHGAEDEADRRRA